MDVAVKGTPAHGGEKKGAHDLLDQRPGVDAQRSDLGQIVNRHAVEELHGEDVATGQLGIGLGDRDLRQPEFVLEPPEVNERTGLIAQIHLLADLHPEAVQHLQGGTGQLITGLSHQDLHERLHEVEVGRHQMFDVGPQHLDRHHATVVEAGPVHHGDGGPPDRDVFEVGEHVTQGTAEVFLDPLAHIDEGDGRSRVQARPELVGHLVTEHPR